LKGNGVASRSLDAGVKALAYNGPVPDKIVGAPEGYTYRLGGDEHGTIKMPGGCIAPKLGSRVLVKTTHCDPTVNLYSAYHVFDVVVGLKNAR
jgi:D-serine deaminase-like pyridoxal phosphate-dependent protein